MDAPDPHPTVAPPPENSKKRNLSSEERRDIVSTLLLTVKPGDPEMKLARGAIKSCADAYGVDRSTIRKVWQRALANYLNPDISRTSKTYCYRQGDNYTLLAVWLQYCSAGNKYWYWKHLRFYRDSAKAFPHGTQWVRRYQVYYLREPRAKTPSCSGCVTVSNSQNDLLSKTAL